MGWQLEGKFLARQCLIMRGVHPMLAAPMSDTGEDLLGEAIRAAAGMGLVKPNAYVVCILSEQGSLVVKIVQVNEAGSGIRVFASRANKLLEGDTPLPSSPHLSSAFRLGSISLKGAGAMGGFSHGGGLLTTMSEFDEAAAAAAAAEQLANSKITSPRYGFET